MKRALPIGKAIPQGERQLKGSAPSAKVAFASAILASAAAASAATITPIVNLDFNNPTIGTYGAVANQTNSQLTAGTSSATFSETDATLGPAGTNNNVAYEFNGSAATFTNNSMSLTGGTGTAGPGLSISPASGTYKFNQNYIMEAEVTSAGAQASGTASIIQWETDGGVAGGTFPRLDLQLTGGVLTGQVSDNNGPQGPAGAALFANGTASMTLATGVETHVALVYNYTNSTTANLSIYIINDATGQVATSVTSANTSVTIGSTDTLPNEIGILNSPEDSGNAGVGNNAGRSPFNGSANGIFVGTFTGAFNPTDATVGGNFTLVPEPASVSLLAAGALLGLRRRRR